MIFQAYTISSKTDWSCIRLKCSDNEKHIPLHLCCIIDTSSSMLELNKLDNIKKALEGLLNILRPYDKLSIVTFSDTAQIVLDKFEASATNKRIILECLSNITTGVNTNLSAGIVVARDTLIIDNNYKQGIILLTDGYANLGLYSAPDILSLINTTIERFPNTPIYCIGYGTDYNADLLQTISTHSGGLYYVINALEHIANIFGNIVGELLSCVYHNVSINVSEKCKVMSGYPVKHLKNSTKIFIGDMSAELEYIILVKSPNKLKITLTGYDIHNICDFELNKNVMVLEDASSQSIANANYVRFNVLDIIHKTIHMDKYNKDNCNIILGCISDYTEYVHRQLISNKYNLWDVLLYELNICKIALEPLTINKMFINHILSQHHSYLSVMRGIPASFNNCISSITAVFSNKIQRDISDILYKSINRAERVINECDANEYKRPYIIIPSSSSDSLPMPTSPLRRQIACVTPTIVSSPIGSRD